MSSRSRRRQRLRALGVLSSYEAGGAPRSDTPSALFSYGIFIDQGTASRTAGLKLRAEPATLRDYKRVTIGCAYIVPNKGSTVPGVLYRGITPDAWRSFDKVEGVAGRHYDRVPVAVVLSDGEIVQAQAYQAGPGTYQSALAAPERREGYAGASWDWDDDDGDLVSGGANLGLASSSDWSDDDEEAFNRWLAIRGRGNWEEPALDASRDFWNAMDANEGPALLDSTLADAVTAILSRPRRAKVPK